MMDVRIVVFKVEIPNPIHLESRCFYGYPPPPPQGVGGFSLSGGELRIRVSVRFHHTTRRMAIP